jgi:hypothetical protein
MLPRSEWHLTVLHSLVPHFREFSVREGGNRGRAWHGTARHGHQGRARERNTLLLFS